MDEQKSEPTSRDGQRSDQDPLISAMLALAIVAVIGSVGFYVWKFFGNPLSNAPSDWGVFGDYFGGVLSATFGLVTVILLMKQSKQIQESAKKTEESAAEAAAASLEGAKNLRALVHATEKNAAYERLVRTLELIQRELDGLAGMQVDVGPGHGDRHKSLLDAVYAKDEDPGSAPIIANLVVAASPSRALSVLKAIESEIRALNAMGADAAANELRRYYFLRNRVLLELLAGIRPGEGHDGIIRSANHKYRRLRRRHVPTGGEAAEGVE